MTPSIFLPIMATVSASKNNVLFMLVDDGGFESPVWGNDKIRTPYIEKFAAQSMRFTNAFTVVSSCSPSRAALLTGLPTHENGMYGLHQYPGNFQAHSDVVSLPNLANGAGYKTGIIGKHHVGPLPAFNFTYGTSAEHCWAGALGNPSTDEPQSCRADYNFVSRNVSAMAAHARQFLTGLEPAKPFLLYVGFGDVHRCGFESSLGSFCEHYGVGGAIPDWQPPSYSADDVLVPSFLPDSPAVREDLRGQYVAWSRLDTGVGLLLAEVDRANATESTLVFFFSDNGIPFPSGKTTLFEQGQHEPLLVRMPGAVGGSSNAVVSSLDLMPTMLDWLGVDYPAHATAAQRPVTLGGGSLLPLLRADASARETWRDTAFGSHQFHSLYAFYPMRSLRTARHRLIHNIVHNLRFPILEDVEATATWKQIEAAGEAGNATGWVYDYRGYMLRPEWQLFDVVSDPLGLDNLAGKPEYADVLQSLQRQLREWQVQTHDPWTVCNPALPAHDAPWTQSHSEVCSF